MQHFTINANVMLGKTIVIKCLFLFPYILLLLLLFFLHSALKGPLDKTKVKNKDWNSPKLLIIGMNPAFIATKEG